VGAAASVDVGVDADDDEKENPLIKHFCIHSKAIFS